jgi:Rgg/GadR/MutR family transcriptional activator
MKSSIFRRLRLEKKLTLTYVAGDTVSVATLSRFENGKADLSVEKLKPLLARMNVSLSEYAMMTDDQVVLVKNFEGQIAEAYQNNKSIELAQLCKRCLLNYRATNVMHHLLQAAAAANYHRALGNENELLKPDDIKQLVQFLESVETWGRRDLANLANTTFILPSRYLQEFALTISGQLSTMLDSNFNTFVSAWNAVLNIVFTLIVRNTKIDLALADHVIHSLDASQIPYHLLFTRIRFNYLNSLLSYGKGNVDERENIQSVIKLLDKCGCPDIANEFHDAFLQVSPNIHF